MTHMHIITLGRADHGKTTLLAAISKVLSEKGLVEKRDFESIHTALEENVDGAAYHVSMIEYGTPNRNYSYLDCPDYADHIKIMIVSPVKICGAILVVDASEGLMPQTKEHIALACQTGIPKMVVYLNKLDLVEDKQKVELLKNQLSTELENFGFGDSPMIEGSALGSLNGDPLWVSTTYELMDKVDLHIPSPVNDDEIPFLMPVEDVYSITQRGTVVTGKIERGVVKVQEEVEIVGLTEEKRKIVLSDIETSGTPVTEGKSGDQVELFMRGIQREEIEIGQVVAKTGSITPHKKFVARVYLLSAEEGGRHKPFFNNYKPQFIVRNANITGVINLPEGLEMCAPGVNTEINVQLETPVALEQGLRFTIWERDRTVGIGKVTALIS
jgi:elongation factor Tu